MAARSEAVTDAIAAAQRRGDEFVRDMKQQLAHVEATVDRVRATLDRLAGTGDDTVDVAVLDLAAAIRKYARVEPREAMLRAFDYSAAPW
jgi:ABC-type transporter Mla subunit MlaD